MSIISPTLKLMFSRDRRTRSQSPYLLAQWWLSWEAGGLLNAEIFSCLKTDTEQKFEEGQHSTQGPGEGWQGNRLLRSRFVSDGTQTNA